VFVGAVRMQDLSYNRPFGIHGTGARKLKHPEFPISRGESLGQPCVDSAVENEIQLKFL